MAEANSRPRASRRTRVVGALKILLPGLALALLGAVILWRAEDDPGLGLTFAASDLATYQAGLKVTEPQLSGASLNGDLYDFRASEVVPENLDITRARIEVLNGKVIFRDGREVRLASQRAVADFEVNTILLEDGIEIVTSDGYTANANQLMLDLATSVLTAQGPVTADGPLGAVEAGALRIEPSEDASGLDDALIQFTGGVTLRYDPADE